MDGSRASGNLNVHVLGSSYQYSFRLLPHGFLLDEDSESLCMRHIISPPRKLICLKTGNSHFNDNVLLILIESLILSYFK